MLNKLTGRKRGVGDYVLVLAIICLCYCGFKASDSEPRKEKEPSAPKVQTRKERIEKGFSTWNGSHRGSHGAAASVPRVRVTHLISKRVKASAMGGTFRYFFDIRNHGTEPFVGEVEIDVAKSVSAARESSLGGDTFTAKKAIQPGAGTYVYLDRHTAPATADLHGDYGTRVFKWTIRVNGRIVNSGIDSLNDKYEDSVNR